MVNELLLGFFSAFGFTGVALVVAIALVARGRVEAHILAVWFFVLGFAITILLAEAVGQHYVFDRGALGVHRPIAELGALGILAPLVTGWRALRGSGSIAAHKAAVAWFLTVFLAAVVTGAYMLSTGTRV